MIAPCEARGGDNPKGPKIPKGDVVKLSLIAVEGCPEGAKYVSAGCQPCVKTHIDTIALKGRHMTLRSLT